MFLQFRYTFTLPTYLVRYLPFEAVSCGVGYSEYVLQNGANSEEPEHPTWVRIQTLNTASSRRSPQSPWNTFSIRTSLEMSSEKYTRKYFEERIDELREQIKASLPTLDVDACQAFTSACKSLENAQLAASQSSNVLALLQKENSSEDAKKSVQDLITTCDACSSECLNAVMASAKPLLETVIDKTSRIDEATLLECTILVQATPSGMSNWVAQQPQEHSELLDEFLSNCDWMKQMILAGGASNGNYGQAIAIHRKLLQAMHDESDGSAQQIRHKLALAVSTELATPIAIFKKEGSFVDPFHRFWHYVHAFEAGELDPHFEDFTVWEIRMIIDCNAEDHELQWARNYLKAYRPDQIWTPSDKWRYLMSVRTDLGYREPEHEYPTYKDMISAGGKCGPRAFFGRFICKAWGTPTWGVKQVRGLQRLIALTTSQVLIFSLN